MAFTATMFTERKFVSKLSWKSLAEFQPNWKKKTERKQIFILRTAVKCGFNCANFHENHSQLSLLGIFLFSRKSQPLIIT
jgi:hypothetical protein